MQPVDSPRSDLFPLETVIVFKDEQGNTFLYLIKVSEHLWANLNQEIIVKKPLGSWIEENEEDEREMFSLHVMKVEEEPIYVSQEKRMQSAGIY